MKPNLDPSSHLTPEESSGREQIKPRELLQTQKSIGGVAVSRGNYDPILPPKPFTYPPPNDPLGIRVSIPGHPEIVAYKLSGIPRRDHNVDYLLELNRLIKAQEAAEEN